MPAINKKIDWKAIKADYEIEKIGIRALERKYNIASSTIATRMKREEWVQGRYEQKITSVVSTIQNLAEQTCEQERALIQPKFDAAVKLMDVMNHFISEAADMNLTAIRELKSMDLPNRITGLSRLKATMPELANLSGVQKTIAPIENDDSDKIMINIIGQNLNLISIFHKCFYLYGNHLGTKYFMVDVLVVSQ